MDAPDVQVVAQEAPEQPEPEPVVVEAQEPPEVPAPTARKTADRVLQIGTRFLSRFAFPPAQAVPAPQAQPAMVVPPVAQPQLAVQTAEDRPVVKECPAVNRASFWQLPAFWHFLSLVTTYAVCLIVACLLYQAADSLATSVSRGMDLLMQACLPPPPVVPEAPEAHLGQVIQGDYYPVSTLDNLKPYTGAELEPW